MRATTVLLASCLSIAACGGSDSTGSPTTTVVSSTSTQPPVTAPATSAPATDPPSDTTTPAETSPPSTEPPASDTVTVESPDGNLTLVVDNADFDRVSPTIGILDPADWPPEVAGGANLPGVTLYDLQPEGAAFEQPVMVTRRVAAASFPDLGPFDIPVITLLTYSDGEYELLDDLSVARLGADIYVTGSTSHFSNLLTSSEGEVASPIDQAELGELPVRSVASALDRLPGLTFGSIDSGATAVVTRRLMTTQPSDLALAAGSLFDASGEVVFGVSSGEGTITSQATKRRFEIVGSGGIALGTASARLTFPFRSAPSAARLLGDVIDDEIDTFEFEAWLFLSLVPDELFDEALNEVDRLFAELQNDIDRTVEVYHDVFGGYPSSTRRRYSGLPSIPSGFVGYSALFDGELSDPRLVSAARIEDGSGDWEVESGIECYCEYGELFFFFGEENTDLITMLDSPAGRQNFWVFAAGNTSVVTTLAVADTATGYVKRFQVGPTEGPIVTDTAAFATVP